MAKATGKPILFGSRHSEDWPIAERLAYLRLVCPAFRGVGALDCHASVPISEQAIYTWRQQEQIDRRLV